MLSPCRVGDACAVGADAWLGLASWLAADVAANLLGLAGGPIDVIRPMPSFLPMAAACMRSARRAANPVFACCMR
eukprot:365920-Chlamydomonas_euryale.AAC.20